SELDADGDTLFGLADLGFGCPELGAFSLSELASLRLPFGLRIERDLCFAGCAPLTVYAQIARRHGSIIAAEQALRTRAGPRQSGPSGLPLPPDDEGRG